MGSARRPASVTEARRDHLLFGAVFLASRLLLHLCGFRLYFTLDWMFLADPADLRERLLPTLVDFHVYPPLLNLVAGVALKLAGDGAAALVTVLWWTLGLTLSSSLLALLRAFGLGRRASFATALGFALIPPSLYLEHLFGDALACAALLALAAWLLHRAVLHQTTLSWTAFFGTGALLALLRGTFHLSWLAVLLALALVASPHARRVEVLRGALGPVLVVTALYLKNLALFGFFGAASQTGILYHLMVRRTPVEERAAWVHRGELSPLSLLNVYGSPRQYAPYFVAPPPDLPPVLADFEKRSNGQPNFNHWFMLDASRVHRSDALACVKARPRRYLRIMSASLVQFFGPTTRWHPQDTTPRSPHHAHRALLGGYERAFETVFHRVPVNGVGLYLFLPLPLWAAVRRLGKLWRTKAADERARAAVLAFVVFQILFVAVLSNSLSYTESARYRYPVEALIWFLTALAIKDLAPSVRAGLRRLTGSRKTGTF
jgi:hypothetical protein